MPQHPSAVKRVRQNEKHRRRNHRQHAHVRALIRKIRATDDSEEARALLPEAKSGLDRLVSKGIMHKNKAANYKSKLQKHVNALG